MVAFAWERLKGSTVGQKHTRETLVAVSDDQAWFEGSRLDAPGERVAITCFPEEGYGPPDALGDLEHPHIRAILGSGREATRRYIAMEPVDEALSDHLAAH